MATVKFYVKEPDTTPIETVLVRVYDDPADELQGQGYTNSDGRLDLILDDDDYLVRIRYDGAAYSIASPQTFTVAGVDITVNLTMALLDDPTAVHPKLCRVFGTLLDPNGLPLQESLRLTLKEPYMYLNEVFLASAGELIPDSTGYVEADFVRNREYTKLFGVYGSVDASIFVPDRASATVGDIFFPRVSAISPTTLDLSVDETYSFASFTYTLSDDQEGDSSDITFSSDDEDVVEVQAGQLLATGAGSATVTVTYEDDHRDSYTVDTISVTVT